MNTEIIAFVSAASVFRKKTAENQRKAFDALAEEFKAEFSRDISEDDWQICVAYQNEKAKAKAEREKARIERENAKAATLAAMPVSGGTDDATGHIVKYAPGKYLLTVAQNNTDVDADFLASLKVFAERHDAKILAAQTLYNKKAFRQPGLDEQDDLWFDPAIKPFLVDGQIDLGGLHFVANSNVIPTAKWPTSGFNGITPNGVDAIIPATKIELRVGAALKGAATKRIAATGAVTKRNYILRKTGAIANFGHCIAALFVDTESGTMRHLHQVDGASGFYDLDGFYSPNGFKPDAKVAAIQPGDIHAEKMETANMERLLDLINDLQPANIILHDVLDFSSRNHHNIKDPMFLHAQFVKGATVAGDLGKLAVVLDDITDCTSASVHIVESNHDLAIETWIKTTDWRTDPINAEVYLDVACAKVKAQANGKPFNMLEYAYEAIGEGENASRIDFHTTDESLSIAGVEMGNHGHNGANGSRGSPKQFAELGMAINTGHTHSPSIYWPCFTAGVTASLEMGYNVGASSWAIADVITYENGQRQILFA